MGGWEGGGGKRDKMRTRKNRKCDVCNECGKCDGCDEREGGMGKVDVTVGE